MKDENADCSEEPVGSERFESNLRRPVTIASSIFTAKVQESSGTRFCKHHGTAAAATLPAASPPILIPASMISLLQRDRLAAGAMTALGVKILADVSAN